MEIQRVTVKEALSWFGQSFELIARRPFYLLGVLLGLTMFSALLSRVYLVGPMLCSVISPLIFAGLLMMVSRFIDRFDLKFEDLLVVFFRADLLYRLLPLSAASLLVYLALEVLVGWQLLAFAGLSFWLWLALSVGVLMSLGLVFALPLVIFESVEWSRALPLSAQAVAANLKPFLVMAALLLLAGGFSAYFRLLMMPYTLLLSMVLYMAFRRIFEPPEPVLLAAREVFDEEPAPC